MCPCMLMTLIFSDQGEGEGGEESWSGAHGSGGGEGGTQVFSGQHPQGDTDTVLLFLLPVSSSVSWG